MPINCLTGALTASDSLKWNTDEQLDVFWLNIRDDGFFLNDLTVLLSVVVITLYSGPDFDSLSCGLSHAGGVSNWVAAHQCDGGAEWERERGTIQLPVRLKRDNVTFLYTHTNESSLFVVSAPCGSLSQCFLLWPSTIQWPKEEMLKNCFTSREMLTAGDWRPHRKHILCILVLWLIHILRSIVYNTELLSKISTKGIEMVNTKNEYSSADSMHI